MCFVFWNKVLNRSLMQNVGEFKYLGPWLDPNLTFKIHIDNIIRKVHGCLGTLYRSINCFSTQVGNFFIYQLVIPIIDYADIVYPNTSESNLRPLNAVLNSLCRFILNCPSLFYEWLTKWLQPKPHREYHWILFIFKFVYTNCPAYLKQYLIHYCSTYSLRHLQRPTFFMVPRLFSVAGRRAFQYKAPPDVNNLSLFLRSVIMFGLFKSSLFSFLKTILGIRGTNGITYKRFMWKIYSSMYTIMTFFILILLYYYYYYFIWLFHERCDFVTFVIRHIDKRLISCSMHSADYFVNVLYFVCCVKCGGKVRELLFCIYVYVLNLFMYMYCVVNLCVCTYIHVAGPPPKWDDTSLGVILK